MKGGTFNRAGRVREVYYSAGNRTTILRLSGQQSTPTTSLLQKKQVEDEKWFNLAQDLDILLGSSDEHQVL